MTGKSKRRLCLVFILTILATTLFADGLIVIPKPWHPIVVPPRPRPHPPVSTPFPMEVRYHHVNVKIEEMSAATFIDQEFYNPTPRRLEGYYLFPIPKNAAVNKFSMFVDGKEVDAEMLDAQKARKIYEEIVRKQIDPALLEYYGLGVFKARIFPIEPHSTKRVKISYQEVLAKDNGTIAYRYPLNTEKFSSKPLKEVRVKVDVRSNGNIKNVYCTSHEAEVLRKGRHHAVVSFEQNNAKPAKDFFVYYNTDRSKIGLSLLTHRESGEEGYFFMNISPDFEIQQHEIEKKDITFVLDVSGSMAGEKLDQAKKALRFCVANLNNGDRFEIVRFSTEAEALFGKLAQADKANRDKTIEFIKDLKAIGGTNIEEALQVALKTKNSRTRPFMVLFMTDGKPTIGQTKEDSLVRIIERANLAGTRIFTFGIGHEINTHLLDKITNQTRAYRTYASPEENIEIKISDLYTKIQSPVITNLEFKAAQPVKIFKTYPRELPDLFKGSSITVLGRYKGNGRVPLTLSGTVKGKKQSLSYTRAFAKTNLKHEFIASLWAARRVGYLLEQIRLHGEDKELIDEITQLARKHGIITPYTSYLILEDEADQVARRRMAPEFQTLGAIAPARQQLAQEAEADFKVMANKSGSKSVRASKEIQALNQSYNAAQIVQGKSRLKYKDASGIIQNLAQQYRNIQGRAVYQTGKYWVDSRIQQKKKAKSRRIQFASAEYFDLLKHEPAASQFLALGRNVRFVIKDQLFEIYD